MFCSLTTHLFHIAIVSLSLHSPHFLISFDHLHHPSSITNDDFLRSTFLLARAFNSLQRMPHILCNSFFISLVLIALFCRWKINSAFKTKFLKIEICQWNLCIECGIGLAVEWKFSTKGRVKKAKMEKNNLLGLTSGRRCFRHGLLFWVKLKGNLSVKRSILFQFPWLVIKREEKTDNNADCWKPFSQEKPKEDTLIVNLMSFFNYC